MDLDDKTEELRAWLQEKLNDNTLDGEVSERLREILRRGKERAAAGPPSLFEAYMASVEGLLALRYGVGEPLSPALEAKIAELHAGMWNRLTGAERLRLDPVLIEAAKHKWRKPYEPEQGDEPEKQDDYSWMSARSAILRIEVECNEGTGARCLKGSVVRKDGETTRVVTLPIPRYGTPAEEIGALARDTAVLLHAMWTKEQL